MFSTRLLVFLGLCLLVLGENEEHRARLQFHSEQSTLRIETPVSKRKSFSVTLGDFGEFPYGASYNAFAVYLNNDYTIAERDCGDIGCQYFCSPLKKASPPYSVPDSVNSYLAVIDRGPRDINGNAKCSFITKAYNAQLAGFSGALILSDSNTLTTMDETSDEEGKRMASELNIPSVLLKREDADLFREVFALQGRGTEPLVRVSIDFEKPAQETTKVSVDLWMTSKDNCGQACANLQNVIKELTPYIKALVNENRISFAAHFITWTCPSYHRQSEDCKTQCIFGNRYCSPDPDGDFGEGYTGADVAAENHREICLQEVLRQEGLSSTLWLDYINQFWKDCSMADKQFTEDCSHKVFRDVIGSKHVSAWQDCIGDPTIDEENEQFKTEIDAQIHEGGSSIAIDPTFRINKAQYRGSLHADAIMKHVCASFIDFEEPEVCDRLSSIDRCKEGESGHKDCNSEHNRKAHRTRCEATFSGHECVCEHGFREEMGADDKLVCRDINECLEDTGCDCPRCACHNKPGYHTCERNLPDPCTRESNYGGCWNEYIDGALFHACVDNILEYKHAALQSSEMPALAVCQCPPCFEQTPEGGCKPKCDLKKECNEDVGACVVAESSAASLSAGVIVLITFVCLVFLLAVVAASYHWQRRQNDRLIRETMKEYMVINSQGNIPQPGFVARVFGGRAAAAAAAAGPSDTISTALNPEYNPSDAPTFTADKV